VTAYQLVKRYRELVPERRRRTMTLLQNRPNSALLVVDVQNSVVANAFERDAVIANIGSLVGRARAEQVPVVWVQHFDEELVQHTDGWAYVSELQHLDSEPVVHKQFGDSFESTTLEAELAARGVGRLIVTGAQTDACIRATLHGGFVRGYDITLVANAHTTEDFSENALPPAEKVIAHTNMYWTWQRGPGRTATVVDTADVSFDIADVSLDIADVGVVDSAPATASGARDCAPGRGVLDSADERN
jgi:nicotinamidase-related amidase